MNRMLAAVLGCAVGIAPLPQPTHGAGPTVVTLVGGIHWLSRFPGLPRGVPAPNSRRRVFPYAEFQQPLFFGRLGILPTTVSVCRARNSRGNANYVCRSMFYALLSSDGGRTWPATRRFPVAARQGLLVWQPRTATTWYAIADTRLWFTSDAGVHWTSVNATVPTGYRPVEMQFVTQNTGWLIVAKIYQPDGVAQVARLLRTDDGGRHWSNVQLPHRS